jgi:hypothetical protein
MGDIKDQVDIIKEVVKTQNMEQIINVIKNINPIILMYYQMMDNSFEYYTDKLPEDYFNFDVDEAIDIFIDIGDASFVNYIIKEFNLYIFDCNKTNRRLKGTKIIEEMIDHYVENDDINNLNIIHENSYFEGLNEFNTTSYVIDSCVIQNNPKILELFLMNPNNNNIDDAEPENFTNHICSHIMYRGDFIDIIKVFHDYSKKFPDFIDFNFDIVFNSALVNGREKCMEYALNNGVINYHYEKESSGLVTINGIYPFTDTIMYSIIGKNINCVKTVFEIFMKDITINEINNWEQYFNFASVYGNLEIIQYMIILKPYLVEQITDFYNNILKFALCEGNIDIVKFAMINGAKFHNNMLKFVDDFNNGRCSDALPVDNDYIDFYMMKFTSPPDFKDKYIECMMYIHNKN